MRRTLNQDLNFNKDKSQKAIRKLLTPSDSVDLKIKGHNFKIAKNPLSSSNWGFNYTNLALSPNTYILTVNGADDVWLAESTQGENDLVTNELASYMDELVSFLGFSKDDIDTGASGYEHFKDDTLNELAKKGLQG